MERKNKMDYINQIKNIIILIMMSVVGLFVWKTKSDNENLKEDLMEVKETIKENTLKAEQTIAENKVDVIQKESETTVKVVEELAKDIKKVDLEGHSDGKTFNITV